MGRGTTRCPALVAGAVALGMISLACSRPERGWEARGPSLGSVIPPVFATWHSADTKIIWLLRADDCASCSLPTRELRRLQRGGRPAPPLIVVVVAGSVDLVRDFLRQERIPATVGRMSAAAYRATFGSTPLPTLFVIHRDTVVGRWPGAGWAGEDAITRRIDLGQVVSRLSELELAVGRASSPDEQ